LLAGWFIRELHDVRAGFYKQAECGHWGDRETATIEIHRFSFWSQAPGAATDLPAASSNISAFWKKD
jgi:hypothetical protein